MLLLVTLVLLAVALRMMTSGWRLPFRGERENLGWMSAQWLAEYRASHGL